VSGQLFCPDDARRKLVRESALNAIDFLEVLPSQRTLLIQCFGSVEGLDAHHVLVEGGVRVRGIEVQWAQAASELTPGRLRADEQARIDQLDDKTTALVVRTSCSGDFSTYTLRLVESPARPDEPAPGFDIVLSAVPFSFKVDCPTDFDCATETRCEDVEAPPPQIDYLAKDYSSVRRLIFDRLSVLVPDWRERNPADVLVTLVELLAYSADRLSYFQDAVATEAYLGTARRRASVRRHARLIDYLMHDGASARAWLVVEAGAGGDGAELPRGTMVLTGEIGAQTTIAAGDVGTALTRGATAFETLHALALKHAHDRIALYDWGDDSCCLPAGATRATLVGTAQALRLGIGDVLVLEEVRDPGSSSAADADPTHRHAVRLVRAPVARVDSAPAVPVDVVEVEWDAADALPFAQRLTTVRGEQACVARGNVVLADHGATTLTLEGRIEAETIGIPVDGRPFRPRLRRRPVSQAQPYEDRAARRLPAAAATSVDPRAALPAVAVFAAGERWEPQRELLNSDRFAPSFVVECEEDGSADLRFGDGVLGRAPTPDVTFSATYRTGTGRAGNVGAGVLTRVVTTLDVDAVWNPLPAVGGADPEPLEQVRLYAPQAFRTQKRAVTVADYAAFAERHPQVQKAGATRRWTGSWYTIFITVDRVGGHEIDDAFEDELRAFLDPFRLAGQDLEIDGPSFVALELSLAACVAPGYVRGNVRAALIEAFSSPTPRGFFHPDHFTFGQPVYVSAIVATAMGVAGIEWVQVTALHRAGEPAGNALEAGQLDVGRLEIVRLDNDPNRPENGRLELDLKGGL
jgi:hypothetical protein